MRDDFFREADVSEYERGTILAGFDWLYEGVGTKKDALVERNGLVEEHVDLWFTYCLSLSAFRRYQMDWWRPKFVEELRSSPTVDLSSAFEAWSANYDFGF